MNTRRGLHTIFDLETKIERDGRHWIWQGIVDVRGRPEAHLIGLGAVKGPRITAVVLGRSHERKPDQRWFAQCGDRLCLSPHCLRLGTPQQAFAAAAQAGRLKRTADQVARNVIARNRRRDVYPGWMVEWALESPQTNRDAAWGLDVDRSTVGFWRRAETRREPIAGPFSQLLRLAA